MEERFKWYFPSEEDSCDHFVSRQGWKSTSYLSNWVAFRLNASEQEVQELKGRFASMELLPSGSPKDKLWVSTGTHVKLIYNQ